ncbi:MAG TPA: hypothetical protein VFA94_08915 [Acidimicrobiales bacterium]|nr:hypothetical protein [Acidimicrobiales bacterium]
MLRRAVVLIAAVITASTAFLAVEPAAEAYPNVTAGEYFVVSGNWQCDNSGCTAVSGTSTSCAETEAEVVGLILWDVAAPVVTPPCGAHFSGNLTKTCTFGNCEIAGNLGFYFNDASDPGYTIGPIQVALHGVYDQQIVITNPQGAGVLTIDAALSAADVYQVDPTLVWNGAGSLSGGCSGGSGVVLFVGCQSSTFTLVIGAEQND